MPWVVLVTVLGLTAGTAAARADAVANGQDAALAAAEGHFRDVVTDHERRSIAVSQAYERVLVGAVFGLESPVSPGAVEQRLDALAAVDLPASIGFLVVPNGAEPVRLGDAALGALDLRDTGSATGLWVDVVDTGEDLVAVGYTTVNGDVVAAIVSTTNLLAAPSMEDHGHGGLPFR